MLWLLVAALSVVYASELRWAARGLPLYWSGGFPTQVERELAARARELAAAERYAEALAALEQAVRIDPNSFTLLHAMVLRGAGDDAGALERSGRALELDPASAQASLLMADLLRQQGRDDEAREVLRQGIATLSAEVHLYRPRLDRGVPEPFNRKAEEVYARKQRGLAALREALRQALRP